MNSVEMVLSCATRQPTPIGFALNLKEGMTTTPEVRVWLDECAARIARA